MISNFRSIYMASALFSDAEKSYNELVCSKLENCGHTVFLPQRDGRLYSELLAQGANPEQAARQIFLADIAALRSCDTLVAILDGRTVDEGVAFELGLAFSLNKYIVSLQTDCRRLLPAGNNPMIDCSVNVHFNTIETLLLGLCY